MLVSRMVKVLRMTVVSGVLISAAGAASADAVIKIDGSSTMYPITEAVVKNFQTTQKDPIKVAVGVSGTSGGFMKFCRGEIDIVNASRPIQGKEMKACNKASVEYVELPIAFDAITVAVNPKNNWIKTMTLAELKKMWEPAAQGKITKWSQINPAWPDEAFKLYGAGANSGTFDYFTQAVIGKAKSIRGDFTASEDDNVLVRGVASDKNALGFFGFGYYVENRDKVRAVAIDDGSGEGINPSVETVEDGSYRPLSRPIFIYVNMKKAEKPVGRDFVTFYIKNASALVRGARYFPLPPRAYRADMEFFKTKRLGTVFDGFLPVGITIDDLLRREARFYEN
ncbi:PstS family phosphate ABC transporter substrate-binding protein [Nitrosospira briensis]|uniref:PstS family phosphate ABC transporter substrate-binding protein n=1 Tax=Nitrosospira briensis TaxID=35799 RepID=UPI0008EC0B30|nr:PstS family phosphate ABC transporter substrate-binding protein [Nitrosospira briensis]SFN72416.1 phosphate ABC transporter substrate-binding protein, PhoT family [Nitrosospira briensis]